MSDRFSCFIVGRGPLTIRCGEELLSRNHPVCGVISGADEVCQWAKSRKLACFDPSSSSLLTILSKRPFDYLFSIVNFSVLPPEVLQTPRRCAINFHDSLLPTYAGFHATSWALVNGETEHGVTWHEMTDRIDAGGILKQRRISVAEDDTALTLNTKCYEAGITSFSELIDELSAHPMPSREQILTERSYFSQSMRPAAAGIISWSRTAREISALVRASDFGIYPNPWGAAKVAIRGEFFVCPRITVINSLSDRPVGMLNHVDHNEIRVSTADQQVAIRELLTLEGSPVPMAVIVDRFDLKPGDHLGDFDLEFFDQVSSLAAHCGRHEALWVKRLESLRPLRLPSGGLDSKPPQFARFEVELLPLQDSHWVPQLTQDQFVLGAFAVYLSRLSGETVFDLGYRPTASRAELAGMDRLFSPCLPLRVELDYSKSFTEVLEEIRLEIERLDRREAYLRDIVFRYPNLRPAANSAEPSGLPIVAETSAEPKWREPLGSCEIHLTFCASRRFAYVTYDLTKFSEEYISGLMERFAGFLRGLLANPQSQVPEIPLVTGIESKRLISEWNATETSFSASACKHHGVEKRAKENPDRAAVIFKDCQLTYKQLNSRANQLAHYLRNKGVGPEVLVGICTDRSLDMVVGLLAILKAGGAYVPLDPSYPKERLDFMMADAGLQVLLTQERLLKTSLQTFAEIVCIDRDWPSISQQSEHDLDVEVMPENLAYVIYTSGSTGKPKGVMVTHRNVVNFFAGMDERLNGADVGTWLALTSLSFDISVLEIFWTLARGFRIVLCADEDKVLSAPTVSRLTPNTRMDFSLSYFASDAADTENNKYQLLLEGAKFADRNGFSAVWLPERHFHSFGGLFPSPSVAGAALATITEQIHIRAGSVVLPLNSPIRVAEEWSLIDNLSRGRVGISFASGWHANDFVLRPENYAERKNIMFRDLETVRRLWRGEAVSFVSGDGKEVPISILPRPIQSSLPVWVTAAGNPETFQKAGEIGANILTHLLGQSFEEVAKKIEIYRQAWRASGHPGNGHVTLMLHTYVGESMDSVRETVRQPFSKYLSTCVDLIKGAPYAFPTFRSPAVAVAAKVKHGLEDCSPEDMEVLLSFAFDRYFENSGLFGTPEDCLQVVDKARGIGVNEIACLIDFGVDFESVMSSLKLLNLVRERSSSAATGYSIPELIDRHHVTHLQCTPSTIRMLMAEPEAFQSLGSVRKLMLGGEPLPSSIAEQLKTVVSGEIHNMYGPTETTIWSTTHLQNGSGVRIGRPIANTEVYLLDQHLQLVPIGAPGELFIGGVGVARGYLNRPDLTADRFVPNPFGREFGGRLYRTGDLARYLPNGDLVFLGRIDNQVKLRGHRIELGEIEAALNQHSCIAASVVVAKEGDSGDTRLVGYVVPNPGQSIDTKELRNHLATRLPDTMIPSLFVSLRALPLTPNGKVDRKALPEPDYQGTAESAPPSGELENKIASVWAEALNVGRVGANDNFFDLGAHSLMMVQVNARLRETLNRNISLVDMFRYSTVHLLAEFLKGDDDGDSVIRQSQDRVQARKEALSRRRQQPRSTVRA